MKKEEKKLLYECFASRAFVDGQELLFDSTISARLHKFAVGRGFMDGGQLRKNLSPLERIVIVMREATVGAPYDHEWWADWQSSPSWFKKMHEVILETWLFYPPESVRLNEVELGKKIGYELEYQRRKFERASQDDDFVKRWKEAVHGPPQPPNLPPELQDEKVVEVFLIEAYDDWKEYSVDSLKKLETIRQDILRLSAELGSELGGFLSGMAAGTEEAKRVNLDDDLLGSDERETILRILEDQYELIAQLRNRREIADFIIAQFPESRREFLKNVAQHDAFTERLRNTYLSKIELRPAARGMPKKSEKLTPRRSRILIYTPDVASRSENDSK